MTDRALIEKKLLSLLYSPRLERMLSGLRWRVREWTGFNFMLPIIRAYQWPQAWLMGRIAEKRQLVSSAEVERIIAHANELLRKHEKAN